MRIWIAKGSIWWILTVWASALISSVATIYDHRFRIVAYFFISLTILFLAFFRDPTRTPDPDDVSGRPVMLSPADGRVMAAENGEVHIFMNFNNVHVNRTPISGQIKSIKYIKGSRIPAFMKGSVRNERNLVVIENDDLECTVTQIAGTVTRRIVPYIKEGDFVKRGDRIGMIRFGSRVDMTIPPGFEPVIRCGDKVYAGKTVIAIRRSGTRKTSGIRR
ncbi:MAG: phosphatidylserine decarboxylase family protein [Candidatus Methanogaster sp.]|uniref:Phosphatidylserine decarboxylase family protein n=1 Tax=Candidatus Methanogaster sp. TaxID=3386292 RepID=A0AC61L3K8_9EURY|nr:MAG: phosphatidylserine decarboxylase family protein [ANME-2 cluster archaeon]